MAKLFDIYCEDYNRRKSKNGQVNQQASADRPVSSLLGLVRTLQHYVCNGNCRVLLVLTRIRVS